MDQSLIDYLGKHGITYVVHEHPAVFTVADSQELKKQIPGLHCKTLFLKDNAGRFYLVGLPADKRLDSKKLKQHLDVKKLRFATEEELKEEIHLVPGSVSIFGAIYLKESNMLVLDRAVWEAEHVGFHPNVNTATLEIAHEDLEKFYESLGCGKEVVDL